MLFNRWSAGTRSVRAILAAGTALIAVAPALAQGTAQSAGAAVDDSEIVITGSRPIAESQAAALAIQRASPSLVSVIASDAVGRLPDQNIAQAVSRLPGVAVQRDQGQARYINLRGAPINWTTLSFDGIIVVSPEGRDARFDSIPSAIASQIVVRKAVTPNMTGETIAGNVDIVTRSAFDYSGFHIAGKAGVGYVELGKNREYEGQLVLADRFDTGIGEFGVLVSGSMYERRMVTDNFESDFEVVPRDRRPGNADRAWARETENKLYRLTRRNYSGSARLDWRPDGDNRIFLTTIYSAFTDDEQRNNYIFDLDDQESTVPNATAACTTSGIRPPALGGTNGTTRTTGYADVCTGNTPFLGTNYGVDINSNFLVRDYRQSIFTATLGGDHDAGALTIKWRGNFTRSTDDRSAPVQLNYDSPSFANAVTGRPTVFYDLTDNQLGKVELYRTIVNADGTFGRGARVRQIEDFPLALTRLRSLIAKDVTNAYTGRVDLAYDAQMFGGDVTFTVGGQYDRRTKESNELSIDLNGAAAIAARGLPTPYSTIAQEGAFLGEIPLGYDFRYFGKDAAIGLVDQAIAAGATFAPVPQNFYKVREEVFSGYGMALAKFDWGNIVAGARVEHIRNNSAANAAIGTTFVPVVVERSQTLVYPSLHFNWDLDRSKKVRLSFNTGAARPDYDVLRPNFTVDDANRTIAGGNPEADPERARGADLYFEWYVQPQGFVSLGAYYRDVKDALFNFTQTFNSTLLNSATIDRSDYAYSTVVNGGDGYIWGIEAAVQGQLDPFTTELGLPDWIGGFGLLANGNYNKSRATTPDGRKVQFPGTSEFSYNLGAYYEKYGFSARVNYQKRTPWIDGLGPFNAAGVGLEGGDFFWGTDDELDVSARFAITRNIEIYVDGSNLLNGPGRRYAGISARTIEHETFGRRYTGGVRVNF